MKLEELKSIEYQKGLPSKLVVDIHPIDTLHIFKIITAFHILFCHIKGFRRW